MSARLLDGIKIAEQMKRELAAEMKSLSTPPRLAVLYFSGPDHLSSHRYWFAQQNAARLLGIDLIGGMSESSLCSPLANRLLMPAAWSR